MSLYNKVVGTVASSNDHQTDTLFSGIQAFCQAVPSRRDFSNYPRKWLPAQSVSTYKVRDSESPRSRPLEKVYCTTHFSAYFQKYLNPSFMKSWIEINLIYINLREET